MRGAGCGGVVARKGFGWRHGGQSVGSQQKAVEELFFQNETVSLCLLVNRRAARCASSTFGRGVNGKAPVRPVARATRRRGEGLHARRARRSPTWVKLGFSKEGNIPGFYKRSDAFLLGSPVESNRPQRDEPKSRDEPPVESETRLVAAQPIGAGQAVTAAQELMERTLAAAKRAVRDMTEKPVQAKVAVLDEHDARKAVSAALRSGRALTAFESFGRDVERRYVLVSTRGGLEFVASTESQACFCNAYLELLQSPRNDSERAATVGGLRALCDKLLSEEVVSCFSLAPSDDVALAIAFLHNGFRRTGLLVNRLVTAGRRKDAILWSRKLAAPFGRVTRCPARKGSAMRSAPRGARPSAAGRPGRLPRSSRDTGPSTSVASRGRERRLGLRSRRRSARRTDPYRASDDDGARRGPTARPHSGEKPPRHRRRRRQHLHRRVARRRFGSSLQADAKRQCRLRLQRIHDPAQRAIRRRMGGTPQGAVEPCQCVRAASGITFHFDPSFDRRAGYVTRSMLAAPLISQRDEVIGVIQLINKKRDPSRKLSSLPTSPTS